MKKVLLILIIALATDLVAQDRKSDRDDIARDLRTACELSRLKQSLLKTEEFKDYAAVVAVMMVEFGKVGLHTPEAKQRFLTLIQVTVPSDKEKAWQDVAAKAGIKNWNCPTIRTL